MDVLSTRQNSLIFIAYDLTDVEFVERICASLRALGHRISLTEGDENRKRTGYQNKAMRECGVMLVVVSPESIQKSRTVRRQVEHFDWLERPIIALHLREVEREDWFVPLSTAKKIDFLQWADDREYARALGELDSTLRSLTLPGSFLFRPTPPSQGLPNPHPTEIVEVYTEFPLADFERWVKKSRQSIHLADVWTPIVSTHDEAVGMHGEAIAQAALRNVQIKILLLNPASPVARRRSLDLRLDENEVFENVRVSIDQIKRLSGHISRGLRLYKSLPSFPIYVVDENMLFGQYPYGRRSFAGLWFQVQGGSFLFQTIMDEFESRWNDATEYTSIEWLIDLLTAKEVTVLRQLASGNQVPQIASNLHFSAYYIQSIIKEICGKLDVLHLPQRNRQVAAINRARDLGIID